MHFDWLRQQLESIDRAFRARIKALPDDYPDEKGSEDMDELCVDDGA
ncbi:MAG: hypothetical protein ACFHWZ_06905 [Phycisphaerales bacterium]